MKPSDINEFDKLNKVEIPKKETEASLVENSTKDGVENILRDYE